MGASFNSVSIVGSTIRTRVVELFTDMQDQDRYENGHSYSGGFGMANGLVFVAKTFDTEEQADTWLENNCQKWGPAVAVTVKGPPAKWVIGAWCSS